MKERPILFSGPMVRALLDGRKTQTRRIVKNQPADDVASILVSHFHPTVIDHRGEEAPGTEIYGAYSDDGEWGSKSPYGEPGDRLWVRETWNTSARCLPPIPEPYIYAADLNETGVMKWAATWKPSIHMPRAASRIMLEVTAVRVEQLQDISENDAIAEGCADPADFTYAPGRIHYASARGEYALLWDGLNAKRGFGWGVNPWVWVIEFRRIET